MPERRSVLDTHTLVGRLLLPAGTAGRAVDHALALGVPLVSDDTLAELAAVLSRPKFDRWVTVAERQRFIALQGGMCRRVAITHRVQASRNPRGDKFLHVALNGEAEVIVTGDADLLVLHLFHGVQILSPAGFLTVIV